MTLLHLAGVPWARIGEHVGQRGLAVTANTYSHVLANEEELEYASCSPSPMRWAFIPVVTDQRLRRDAFIAAASEFCRLYENAKELGSERFLLGLAAVLPRLHAAAVELPYPDDAIPDDDLDVRLATEEVDVVAERVGEVLRAIDWERIRGDLRESRPEMTAGEAIEILDETRESLPESTLENWALARDNLRKYLPETRSPDAPDPLPVDFYLYEDLDETYRDLMSGFRLIEVGRPEAEAVIEWRLSFWSHWGGHNVEALRVIHHYVALDLAG